MIALITQALAQGQNSEFVPAGKDCLSPSAIVGTSGYANLLKAVDTNANTYSAAAFAERLGLDQVQRGMDDRTTRGFVVWEVNETFDVARVPAWHAPGGQPDCDAQYSVGMRPVDLQATMMAGVFGTKHVGGFFAASQTSGQVAATDNLMRGLYWGYLYPLYSTIPLVFSPIVPGQSRAGTAVFTLDAVYGGWVDARWVLAKVGYTRSSGFYGNVRDTTIGLFATTVVRGDGSVPVLRAGIQKFDLAKVGGEGVKDAGMPSAYYRDIPLAQPVGVDLAGEPQQRLRTAHVDHQDLGRMFDLAGAFRIRPDATLSEARVAFHSSGYHTRDELTEVVGFGFLEGGMVQLLDQPSLGVEGGAYASVRAEVGFRGPGSALWVHVQLNDAEQLALYPYARNALSLQLHAEVTRW